MKIKFRYKNKNFEINTKKTSLVNPRGLMFRRRENASALSFSFKTSVYPSIHSFFVFFPFLAIWLDEKNRIIEIQRVLPWRLRVLPKTKFSKLIEIPCNKRYSCLVKSLVSN